MASTPLAAPKDVEALLGRDLTSEEAAKADAMLAKASADFRRAAGRRLFTPGTTTARLKVDGGQVWLKQLPVTDVTSVVDDDGRPVPYTRTGQVLCVPLDSARFVTVTYTHGSAEVPDDVVSAVADCVARVLKVDPRAASGVSQTQHSETRGPFTESGSDSFASWAVGGSVMLSPSEMATARSYRTRRPHVWVMTP